MGSSVFPYWICQFTGVTNDPFLLLVLPDASLDVGAVYDRAVLRSWTRY